MLLVSLHPYNPITDAVRVAEGVTLRLNDADIAAVIEGLASACSASIKAEIGAIDSAGQPRTVQMVWQAARGLFSVAVEGRGAGVLTYDELQGALGKAIPNEARPCRVCLHAELDIWRSGVMDIQTGRVEVYTRTPGLATLGASAHFTDTAGAPGLTGLYVRLDPGEPARGPLRVPGRALRAIQNARQDDSQLESPRDSQQVIEYLSELASTVSQFHGEVRCKTGLR